MIITEALGHALVIEPYIDTVVVSGGLLHRAGGPAASLLEAIVAGDALVALAAAEPASADRWQDVSTRRNVTATAGY